MDTVEQLVSFAHIQVHLSGGAPWGFTLKGGLEHGEPLIITKIEDGGKAALCEKLKVGDELININGTVLYGSRQEALILIKGSYRLLRLTVRRRSFPALRPHSWHQDQIPEPALPPPPPPSPPCLPPADSPPLPPPPPSAMQLHPGPYTLPWHNNDHSDLPMQWGQLPRPYSSTDRSSSLGSMESLDTPTPTTQTNYDSHNSPVDPSLFNNKRDSAYSSFSASSNTSDYATVPLRFGEGGSMENLLQNLGTNADAISRVLDNGQLIALKSRSLTRPRPKPIDVKERPSSCCYVDDRKVDDFGILRNSNGESSRKSSPPQPPTRKDSFRATKTRPSIDSLRCASAPIEDAKAQMYFEEGSSKATQNGFADSKEDSLESYYIQNKTPLTCSKSDAETSIYRPHNKHSPNVLHRHSAPEKLLATQLQLLQFESNDAPIEKYVSPKTPNLSSSSSSRWSQSEKDHDSLHNHLQTANKWAGSRCSTPGSVYLEDGGEECHFSHEMPLVNGSATSPSQVPWGRSFSVPEEPLALEGHKHISEQLNDGDFEPLSSASSMDTLVEKKFENVEEDSATLRKSSRNLRKNRRRNERFATNLRNEIQRKKAQLQSSRGGPGGLLCSGETVHEEGPDFQEDGELEVPERKVKVAFAPTTSTAVTTAQVSTTIENSSMDSKSDVLPKQPNTNRSVQVAEPSVPSFGVGIRVVEEPAPAGKARRWRWTPEHKLQPENEPLSRRNQEKLLGIASSRHGVCAFTSSSASSYPRSMSCSRMDESDLLPFADRMKFFEETSKTGVVKAAPSQAKPRPYQSENQALDLGYQSPRRYSYQGGCRQECSSLVEARRQSVSAKEREERLRQREAERQARELEFEKARQREKEKEERMRKWERDREIERQEELQRLREMDRLKREREEIEMRERKEYFAQRSQEVQRRDSFSSFQPSVHGFEQSQVSRSAFCPVAAASQSFDGQQLQGVAARSHTPTETYPARQQETTKLNRKYSLTERDYTGRRWEPRAVEPPQSHQSRWTPRQNDHALSNGYSCAPAPPPGPLRARAMSENDLRFDAAHRWSPSLSATGSQTLSEVEEGPSESAAQRPLRRKMPPPPRPPPPKWEQFHKRRASHHAIYSSSVPQGATGDFSAPSSYEPEMSRRRSYSLPPQRQDLSTAAPACPKCSCHQNLPRDAPSHQPSPPAHHEPRLPPPSYQTLEAQRYPHVQPPRAPFDQSHVPLPNKASQIHQPRVSADELEPTNRVPQIPPSLVQSSNHKQPPFFAPQDTHVPAVDVPPPFVPPPPPPSSNQTAPQLPVFSVAPPSPMFSRRAFRPVAPPQRNSRGSVGEESEEFPPPPPPVADDIEDCLSDSEISLIPDQMIKPQTLSRHAVEWERTPSPTVRRETITPPPPPPPPPFAASESFHSIDFHQNQKSELEASDSVSEQKSAETEESETTLSPSPAQSLEADLDVPLETDIDDFQEAELLPAADERMDSELPCLALPVTVLETDLDLLPDVGDSPRGTAERPESSLLGEEELGGGEGSLEDFFPQGSECESGTESWRGASQSTEHNTDSLDRRSGASSSCSSYYSTSTAKAQLLTQMKDFPENRDRADHDELTYKRQLMESLRKKLGVLREAQRGLQEDIRANTQLGDEVEAMVVSVCKPNEVDKFRMFIGDLDKVVSLMLSLSGRLLRVETTLDTLDSEADHQERLPLLEKKRQLMRQLSEAQDLKEHVDRREQAVSRVLGRCLTPEHHRDYSHFVKMKAALLVEQRQLEDKIRLGEEQLRGLRESLGLGLGVGMGLAMGYGQF